VGRCGHARQGGAGCSNFAAPPQFLSDPGAWWLKGKGMTFWDYFWLMISFLLYVSYLVVLFLIVKDIFSDSTRTGWSKAVWVLVLLIVPVFGGLAYLIAFGQSMSLRQAVRNDVATDVVDDYVRQTGGTNPAEQIAQGKALLDDGALTAQEFAALKQRVLGQ
jgi:hypothetical protein